MRSLRKWTTVVLILVLGAAVLAAKPVKRTLAPAAVKRAQNLALGALKAGNLWFLQSEMKTELDSSGKWAKMEKAQAPWAMVLSCSDSRVPPEILFNRKPGDLFVCRVAGNVANKETLASLEYGAEHLNISVLVVLGHSECGAVKTAMDFYGKGGKGDVSPNMQALLSKLEPCVREVEDLGKKKHLTPEKALDAAIEANVRNTMREIIEQSPELWQLWHEQRLRVVGAIYSLQDGKAKFLED